DALELAVPEPPSDIGGGVDRGLAHVSAEGAEVHDSPAKHGQVHVPRSHRFPVLLRHHAADLRHVSQIVHDPGCQQLPEGYRPKVGMLTRQLELLRAELHAPEFDEIVLAQHLEASQQLCGGATLIQLEVSRSVERLETPTVPLRQDDPGTHDPIGFFGVDEVTYYVEWAPGIGP